MSGDCQVNVKWLGDRMNVKSQEFSELDIFGHEIFIYCIYARNCHDRSGYSPHDGILLLAFRIY